MHGKTEGNGTGPASSPTAVVSSPETARLRSTSARFRLGDPDMAAAASFEKALVHARETEARTVELRAATGLVRLRRLAGDPGTSREVLIDVLGRYTQNDDIPPVVEARHLLAAG